MNRIALTLGAALLALSPLAAHAQQYCGYSGPSYVQPIYGYGYQPCGLPNDAAGYPYPNYAPVYYVQHPYYTLATGPSYYNSGSYAPSYYPYQPYQPSYQMPMNYGYGGYGYQYPSYSYSYYAPSSYSYYH